MSDFDKAKKQKPLPAEEKMPTELNAAELEEIDEAFAELASLEKKAIELLKNPPLTRKERRRLSGISVTVSKFLSRFKKQG
jgi:hypothetical protein